VTGRQWQTKCESCLSPLAVQADALYIAGLAAKPVAERLGLSVKSYQRHVRQGHVARTAQEASRTAHTAADVGDQASGGSGASGRPTAATMAEELETQLSELNAINTSGLSPSGVIALADAKRRAAEALAKVRPAPPGVVRVKDVAGLPEMFDVMSRVLDRHPAVREELNQALRKAGLLKLGAPTVKGDG